MEFTSKTSIDGTRRTDAVIYVYTGCVKVDDTSIAQFRVNTLSLLQSEACSEGKGICWYVFNEYWI